MELNSLVNWILPVVLAVVILLLLYMYGTWTYTKWHKYNIPGPAPVPFLGNMIDIWKKGLFNASLDWRSKYGKTFGVYFMRDAMLLTNDIDILKEVFVKDFSNFSDRSQIPRRPLNYPINHSLPFENGDNWRRMRHTMTPTFSTSKLKLMGPYINRCCDNLSSALQRLSEKRELADVKRIFGAYTMDVIAGTGFGLKTDSLLDENNLFLKALTNMFQNTSSMSWRSVLLSLFPFLRRISNFSRLVKLLPSRYSLSTE
ncbi:cytochrome P450 3A43-like [Pomacea canaliculata]|uniref:cytochrome P450 3A43-like n=1 Tax=Pomacea canaliculata TaxID=400727 RepID=UPI000D7300A3|nr:cytochrome P450 3A43-like [Pomacea canaliculata]